MFVLHGNILFKVNAWEVAESGDNGVKSDDKRSCSCRKYPNATYSVFFNQS